MHVHRQLGEMTTEGGDLLRRGECLGLWSSSSASSQQERGRERTSTREAIALCTLTTEGGSKAWSNTSSIPPISIILILIAKSCKESLNISG